MQLRVGAEYVIVEHVTSGGNGVYGSSYQATVTTSGQQGGSAHQGGATFTFSSAKESKNGTTPSSGQLPGLLISGF